MDNYAIADQFSLLARLTDIHGDNSFKAKSYANTAILIEKLTVPLAGVSPEKLAGINGIGDSTAKKITELLTIGELKTLQQLIADTPEGVLEMMSIKGLGPKKINTLWKEKNIATIAALQEACTANTVAAIKGFGARTQEKILDAIAFIKESKGKILYRAAEEFYSLFGEKWKATFGNDAFIPTGEYRRQQEVISKLEWVSTAAAGAIKEYFISAGVPLQSENSEVLIVGGEDAPPFHIHLADKNNAGTVLFTSTGSNEFLSAWRTAYAIPNVATEEEIFSAAGIHFIPPALREDPAIIEEASVENFSSLLQTSSIKGLIHSHSKWSDGGNTIEEMATELIAQGFEYMVISDHSRSAGYANGLSEERIRQQHKEVDALNTKLAPFKIFKSIEVDILGDGELDYEAETLASLDLVIASIHSNLDMDEDKAMLRLMAAIANPYTTIMGHLTGRLLLKRKAYPVNHKAIIDACAKHRVAIEINASPHRLDIDWRWVRYARQQGVMLSVNPDAHSPEHFGYIKYGVLVGQKGGLTAAQNLSSFSLVEFEAYLKEVKAAKGIA